VSRRKGRILAFQAVYSWEVNKCSLDDLLDFSWSTKDVKDGDETVSVKTSSKDEQTFASLIAAGTIDHVDEIDKIIEAHLSDSWSLERINKVTLAILRTSIYEIKYQTATNAEIVIDEAVNIAKDFGPDDSYKFINAVLDKIGKDESN